MSAEDVVFRYALLNAVRHGGKARVDPVIGKVLSERPDLKPKVKEVIEVAKHMLNDVNAMGVDEQRRLLEDRWPELLAPKERGVKGLPPLPNAHRYPVVRTRMAPNPDAPLHLGNARPLILCHDYARAYKGSFILRFEDTSPSVKPPLPEVYDMIMSDLEWLGAVPDEVYYQSDRLKLYYKYAEELIKLGKAYVCVCDPEEFRKLSRTGKPCCCRELEPSEHLERWRRMLDGTYAQGEAVVRIKTDLGHPNPAVREWPALRIDEAPHPRTGARYRVWALYNFSCAIDDREMGISHVIRGKEHEVNTIRQWYIYDYLGWDYPEVIHVGRLSIEGAVLSKSKIRKGIEDGLYDGWSDPRLFTLVALRRRGIQPDAIRRLMIEVGVKPVNVTVSVKTLEAHNRVIVEPVANRYFFVTAPVRLIVTGVPRDYQVSISLHPSHPERGQRSLRVASEKGTATLAIDARDVEWFKRGIVVRLMELFNVDIEEVGKEGVAASFHSEPYIDARKLKAPLIHWLPFSVGVKTSVIMPDGSRIDGMAEPGCRELHPDEIIQFERFGFVRLDGRVNERLLAFFAHK